MNANNLLPIGSVVLLKNADKKLMVVGIMPTQNAETKDYIAVLYPEGYLDDKHFYTFNHSDIAEISYLGFMDAEHQLFRDGLNRALAGEASDSEA